MNNKYEGKNRIPKTENEITIDINIKDVDNDLIKQYWYLMQNKNVDIVPFKKMFKKIDILINLSKDSNHLFLLFKEIETIDNKKYSNTFLETF